MSHNGRLVGQGIGSPHYARPYQIDNSFRPTFRGHKMISPTIA